jgi:succinate dehydrogenase membrane anchor subunit
VRGWLAAPLNALGVVLLVLVLAYHSKLGVQVVVEDYVHHHGLKLMTLIAIDFAHVLAAAAAVFAVLKVAFGHAA